MRHADRRAVLEAPVIEKDYTAGCGGPRLRGVGAEALMNE